MWLLLAPSALAAASYFPCDDTTYPLETVVRAASVTGNTSVTIGIEPGCDAEGIDHLTIQPGNRAVDWSIVASSPDTLLPPLQVLGGVTLALKNVRIASASTFLSPPDLASEVLGDGPGIALLVHQSTLYVSDVTLEGAGGAGILLVDGDLEGDALTLTGFYDLRAFVAIAESARTTVTLTSPDFTYNASGALAFWGYDEDVVVDLSEGPLFEYNGPVPGADILAYNAEEITLYNAEFTGSSGASDGVFGAAAPISTEGGSFYCNDCNFYGTYGDEATIAKVVLDSFDTFRWTGGEATPSVNWVDAINVSGGGIAEIDNVDFTAAGQIDIDGGDPTLSNLLLDGAYSNAYGEMIKLSGEGQGLLYNIMACNYTDSGAEFIANYGLYTLTVQDNRFQNLWLGGHPLVKSRIENGGELYVIDNTSVQNDAVFIGGVPSVIYAYNNLVDTTTTGVYLGNADRAFVSIDYNLWNDVGLLDSPSGAHDVYDDPRFVYDYDYTSCYSEPEIRWNSPANAMGWPKRDDDFGNAPSDIGARDYDDGTGTEDTGDTGIEDTGIVDTGFVDTAIVDTGNIDTGSPDTERPDRNLPLGLVGGGLAPCGCTTTTPAGSALGVALLLLAARRRR